jgi:exo-1,4-beta-D-glucosaminidase
VIVNRNAVAAGPFAVTVAVRDLAGAILAETRHALDSGAPRDSVGTAMLSPPAAVSRTYFADLRLRDLEGELVSRNVYWLSTTPDVLDWERSTWQYTPASRLADMRPRDPRPRDRASKRSHCASKPV